jgi:DNA-binding NarL/FixJ family response regulator
MIRLFVIEDHPIIVTGLRNLFRPSRDGIEINGSAASAEEAIQTADPEIFDIIMLDLWLQSSTPGENIKMLKEKFPDKPIVMFTSESSSVWQRKMFDAGAKAYLLKTAEKNEIKLTLEKVAMGMTVFAGIMEQDFLNKKLSPETLSTSSAKHFLTPNQLEIAIMLSNGVTQKKIADSKGTSISNIEKTIKHIREAFNARNNAELIKILLEQGII